MNIEKKQYFDWGQIEWQYEPEKSNSRSVMNIGIITIYPEKRQNMHIHYGDEQVIYVLSGEGKQLIGDKITSIQPGSIFHIEAGSTHETINTGEEPLKELLISSPVNYEQEIFLKNKRQKIQDETGKIYPDKIVINDEIEYLFENNIDPLKIPIAIFDDRGEIIVQGNYYPKFCKFNCEIDKNNCNCVLYNIKDEYTPPHYSNSTAFVCPFGLTVFSVPIIYNGKVIGTVKGGHIRESKSNIKIKNSVKKNNDISYLPYDTPKSTVNAILQIMKKLSKNITNYYIFKNTEIELNKKDEIIKDIVKNEILLEESLKNTQDKVLSIQINNHFLFNTLNAIANLAIKEDSLSTYAAIINLSKMFRYTLKNSSYFVQFKDEIDYLKNYINLQKLRYGNKLTVDFNIFFEVENRNVPFNFLQPIIENCFKHGFKDSKDNMKISLTAKIDKEKLVIEVKDNGMGIKEYDLIELKARIIDHKNCALSGLMMIYCKLEKYYENNFLLDITSFYKQGTLVTIHLPYKIA